ncbi:MAG: T9SS type A sorting domain-containing protein [Cytophagaceae bacterium]|nr:T9SS type A sorting domain-containing protein [Cytophagaceae bacterium]
MKIKSFILSFCLLSYIQVSFAQSFEYGATNYKVVYLNGDASSSCMKNFQLNHGGFAFNGGNVNLAVLEANAPLTIQGMPTAFTLENVGPAYFDLFFTTDEGQNSRCAPMRAEYVGLEQDSNFYHINLSGSAKVILRAKSDVPATISFFLGYSTLYGYPGSISPSGTSSYQDGIVKTIQLTTTMKDYVLDFSDWQNRSKVNVFGIYIGTTNAVVSIEEIVIGSNSWPQSANHILGNIYEDVNNDCAKQSGENGLSSIIVEATDGSAFYYGMTDESGDYNIGVDSGAIVYAVTPRFNSKTQAILSNICIPSVAVTTNGAGQDFCCADFALKVSHCSHLSVQVYSDRRRRCFSSNSRVTYANYGNVSSTSTVLKIVYPEFTVPISSVPEWSSQKGDTLIYELGSLDPAEQGFILLVDSVICGREDIRGRAQCLQAIISPKSQCVSIEPAWDGSSVTVSPYCENGVARFVVQNVGLENMTGTSEYRLYSNDTLVFQSTFQLISGNTFQVRYPANGAVIRLEADQRPSHPGRSRPRAFVEGCGAAASQTPLARESLVLSMPQDDLDEEVAISCMTIVDSYDPNDKAAAPVGITDDHLIKAGEQLKYTIRFQNTGTDVAYNIKVVDTLDLNLDVASFVEGAVSHPYVLQFTSDGEKTILNYIFKKINLKDSTTNEPESHGLISFYIKSKADLADGNTLHNKADIFFDYNSAIVTNIVDHMIGTYVPTDLSKGNKVQVITGLFEGNESSIVQRVTLYPNPASDVIQVKLQEQITDAQLIILDLSSHEVYSGALKGELSSVSLAGLSSGMYMYKVQSNGEYIGVGKLVVK